MASSQESPRGQLEAAAGVVNDEFQLAETALLVWLRRARHGQHSHYEASKFYRNMHYAISVPVVVLTTIVGTTAFSQLHAAADDGYLFVLGSLSMVAAVLGALQAHFKFSESSEKHKTLGSRYGSIRRQIERIISFPRETEEELPLVAKQISLDLDRIADEGPVVPSFIWNRTLRFLDKKDKQSDGLMIGAAAFDSARHQRPTRERVSGMPQNASIAIDQGKHEGSRS